MTKHQLKEYCNAEFENIDAVLSELALVVSQEKSKYTTAELAAIATFIHNCYSGIENIVKRILSFKQIKIVDSPTWHKDLLKTSYENEIITPDLYNNLLSYLSFRHFFIHAYSLTLRWEELKPLIDNLEGTVKKFKSVIFSYIE